MEAGRHSESPWNCLSCGQSIDYGDDAISLDDSTELHCCRVCFNALSPAERIEAQRKWRADAKTAKALEAFEGLAAAALSGWHYPGSEFLGRAERN